MEGRHDQHEDQQTTQAELRPTSSRPDPPYNAHPVSYACVFAGQPTTDNGSSYSEAVGSPDSILCRICVTSLMGAPHQGLPENIRQPAVANLDNELVLGWHSILITDLAFRQGGFQGLDACIGDLGVSHVEESEWLASL